MRVIGIDAALRHSGYAVLLDDELITTGVVETSEEDALPNRMIYAFDALTEIFQRHAASGTLIAIEQTDWSPGARNLREAWVREARARYALGIGLCVSVLAAHSLGLQVKLYGANQWRNQFGARNKEAVAHSVARIFTNEFRLEWNEPKIANGKVIRYGGSVVVDNRTGKRVPDHVTDAIGIALVARAEDNLNQRIQDARKI